MTAKAAKFLLMKPEGYQMAKNRLFKILYLLLQNRRMTAQELADRFEVSVRTIYRDVDALSAAGIPVYTSPGRGGGVSLMDHFVLDRTALSEEEQRQLLTALQSLPGSVRQDAGQVLSKLSGLFQRQEPDWIQVELSRWGSGEAGREKFDLLKGAIHSHSQIAFTYVSSYGRTTDRRVLPARLVFKGQAWYLQGYCLEKDDYRTFKITRMLDLQVLETPFDRLLYPPPIEGDGSAPPFCIFVRLRFSPCMAYRVYDEFDESCVTREKNGALVVEVTFLEDEWLYGYLLSFGASVEVLSPVPLREKLGQMALEIWRGCINPDRRRQGYSGIIGSSYTEEDHMMNRNQNFCQSCGMPMNEAQPGTEQDGSPSPHYCRYCYQSGAFTNSMTMEEMIDFCAPLMARNNTGMTEEQAKEQMRQFFPMLLRWKNGCADGQ